MVREVLYLFFFKKFLILIDFLENFIVVKEPKNYQKKKKNLSGNQLYLYIFPIFLPLPYPHLVPFFLRVELFTIKNKYTILRQFSRCENSSPLLSILTSKKHLSSVSSLSLPTFYKISLSKHINIFVAFRINSRCLEVIFKHLLEFASICISGVKSSFTQAILFCFFFFFSFFILSKLETLLASSSYLHYSYLFAYVFFSHQGIMHLDIYHVLFIFISPRRPFTLMLVRTIDLRLWHLYK